MERSRSGGALAFTHHERSGHGGMVLAILVLLAIEGIAVHLLLARWSHPVAWVFTATTIYGGLWLLADYRATIRRPILVDGERIVVRAGLRWSATIPRTHIVAVDGDEPRSIRDRLNLTLLGTPSHWIRLVEPVVVRGPQGIRKRVRAIGLQPDDPEGFSRSLRSPGDAAG